MPLQITLSDETASRLHALSISFEDTPETVIKRLLDLHSNGSKERLPVADSHDQRIRPAPNSDFDLIHAKFESGSFAGISARNWNHLNEVAHREALSALGSFKALDKASLCNLFNGTKTDDGYKPLAGTSISIQGVDATRAMKSAIALAEAMGVKVEAYFRWRDKAKTNAGKSGHIQYPSGK